MSVTVLYPRPGTVRIVATLPRHLRGRGNHWTACGKRRALPSIICTTREHEVTCLACSSKLKKDDA